MVYPILFLFGLAIGSFLNVLALRYDGASSVFDPRVIGGRSHCPHCRKTLRWFELVPVLSWVVQRGHCRSCGAKIGIQYPLVELLSGVIFAAVPWTLAPIFAAAAPAGAALTGWYALSAFWIAAFEVLLLLAYVDLRLQVVPDELVVMLAVIAIFESIFAAASLGPAQWSFLGPYAGFFGLAGSFWTSRIAGAVFGAGFFWLLVLATKGKGMGMGDVAIGAPLGFLFGWPDILPVYGAAFIVGALVGIALVLRARKTMKSAVPFAPFLAAGAALVFFFALPASAWYFRIIGL